MTRRTKVRTSEPAQGLSDERGVSAAYQAHGAELYRFSLRALGDDGMAQDAVQETFLRAWKAADRFDPELSSLRVWLFAIARNVVIDLARRRSARSWANVPRQADLVERGVQPVPDTADRILEPWLVEEALGRLSVEHRFVIMETYIRGRSYEEVSRERGVPVGTLRSRTFYALKALRILMDEMGVSW